jgi:hypothetical protein
MMKKTMRIVPLLFSILLLLASVAVSANAQGYYVEGEIRWVNRFGVVPAGPGDSKPAAAPCSIFSVVALDARTKQPVAYTNQVASPFRFSFFQSVTYVCRYSLKVPEDRDLYIIAAMGNVQLLPKTDRNPYLITGPWIANGWTNQPPAGSERGFTGQDFVTLRSRVSSQVTARTVDFRMTYLNSETLEKAMPAFFAGVWHAKLGGGALELILKQAGLQVTGQVKVNSANLGVIREGTVDGNTLRFKIVRAGRPLGNGANLPDEYVGTGELVMHAGGKSFNGNILGTTTSGTFIGR